MPNQPRFEVVRTDAGYHARYKAANGRIGWTTEVYKSRSAAEKAIESLTGAVLEYTDRMGTALEIRDVDERTPDPATLPPEEAGQAVLRTPIDTPEETGP